MIFNFLVFKFFFAFSIHMLYNTLVFEHIIIQYIVNKITENC